MSFWSSYRGRCSGRVIHFLYFYCGLDVAEQVKFVGDRSLTCRGAPLARYTWCERFGEGDVPVFDFLDPERERHGDAQARRRQEAIDASVYLGVDPEGRVPVDERVLRATIPDGLRRARTRGALNDGAASFFLLERGHTWVLHLKTGRALYFWDRDLRDWLYAGQDPDTDASARPEHAHVQGAASTASAGEPR